MMKINKTLLLTLGGVVLSLAGTAISGVANEKKTKEVIAELVKEELKSKAKEL